MSRYAVKILVHNLDNEGGDDTDDAIVNVVIIADSAIMAARLKGDIRKYDFVGPTFAVADDQAPEILHSIRADLH